MIGRSWPEYVFIRTAILGLRLVAPLSIVHLAASCRAGAFLWSPLLGAYTLVESAFFLFVYLPRSYRLQQDAKYPPRMSRAEREALFYKCANSMTSESISGWFIRSPGEHICRDNVADWLLWALFSARKNDALPEWEEELDSYITVMGSYLVGFVDSLTSISLYTQGFTHYNTRRWLQVFPPRPLLALFSRTSRDTKTNIPYWYRPHRSCTKLPILFIHGIGIGLWPYVPFFRDLVAQDPDVGILAIEILPICMHLAEPPLAREAICDAVTRILDAHGLRRVVLAGHSYGTAISAYLLRRQWGTMDRSLAPTVPPHLNEDHVTYRDNVSDDDDDDDGDRGNLIAAVLLMDPIPFLLHHPSVAYNFVYRQPRRANEWQLWYFASREPDTARALSRHFFWFESVLFREDVLPDSAQGEGRKPLPVAVSLAGRDQIVDAPAIRAYLTGGEQGDVDEEGDAGTPSRWAKDGLEVLYFPDLDHATVFDTRRDRSALLEVLHRFVRQEQPASEAEAGTAGV
ncbi:hypothetical protein BC826DRAFT_1186041 [Russula brevipes]|nr:hypothetical protein BC826DRAFT_1186041 [Russula brevipes]